LGKALKSLSKWTLSNKRVLSNVGRLVKTIVKIDSITPSFCLHHYVQNGLSYLAEETRPTLCKPMPSSQLGIRSKRTNKHQLLHRIASVKTPLIYNKTNNLSQAKADLHFNRFAVLCKIEKRIQKSNSIVKFMVMIDNCWLTSFWNDNFDFIFGSFLTTPIWERIQKRTRV